MSAHSAVRRADAVCGRVTCVCGVRAGDLPA